MKGYIYFMSNPSIPGLIKIGRTSRSPLKRAEELSSTSVPEPFILNVCFLVNDCIKTEKNIHNSLAGFREKNNREFFKIKIDDAIKQSLSIFLPDLCNQSSLYNSEKVNETKSPHDLNSFEQEILQYWLKSDNNPKITEQRLMHFITSIPITKGEAAENRELLRLTMSKMYDKEYAKPEISLSSEEKMEIHPFETKECPAKVKRWKRNILLHHLNQLTKKNYLKIVREDRVPYWELNSEGLDYWYENARSVNSN